MTKALGINIYGGGFTLGVMNHFDVVGQWEQIGLGRKTFDANFEGLYRPLIIDAWPVDKFIGKVPFVYANPPCAPWSSANTRPGMTKAKRFLDQRLQLTKDTMHTAIKLQPKVFISESVENAYNIGESHYDQYRKLWIDQGYHVTYFLTDAILHGSPCARRRFHFIASKYDVQLGECPIIVKPKTVKDAIWDIRNKLGKIQGHDLIPHLDSDTFLMNRMEAGSNMYNTLKKYPEYSGPIRSFLYKKLSWDAPGFTMVGFSFIHPDNRWITKREAARLCTYPDSFKVLNAVETVDAVIPVVANFLATVASNTLDLKKRVKPGFSIVDWRDEARHFHINKYLKYAK